MIFVGLSLLIHVIKCVRSFVAKITIHKLMTVAMLSGIAKNSYRGHHAHRQIRAAELFVDTILCL